MKVNKLIVIRPLRVTDKRKFINLKLKDKDALELNNMLGITTRVYLEWHYKHNFENTKVIIYRDKIIGLIGISEDSTLFFLTTKLDRLAEYASIKNFKRILEELMEEKKVDKVHVYMDASYSIAREWALRGGFKVKETMRPEGNPFEVLEYKSQIVPNTNKE